MLLGQDGSRNRLGGNFVDNVSIYFKYEEHLVYMSDNFTKIINSLSYFELS